MTRNAFAVVLLWTAVSLAGHATDLTPAQTRADKQFSTYVFAHEFGSGVYDYSGRTLQVYGLPFGWNVAAANGAQPGVRLKLPVTVGFLDFQPTDVIHTGLRNAWIRSVSFQVSNSTSICQRLAPPAVHTGWPGAGSTGRHRHTALWHWRSCRAIVPRPLVRSPLLGQPHLFGRPLQRRIFAE